MLLGNLAAKIREAATAPLEDKTKLPLNKSKAKLSERKELPKNEITPPVKAAPAIQDTEAQEKELDEDIDEPSGIQKIAVAPTIEIHPVR